MEAPQPQSTASTTLGFELRLLPVRALGLGAVAFPPPWGEAGLPLRGGVDEGAGVGEAWRGDRRSGDMLRCEGDAAEG